MDWLSVIISLVSGAVGGNIAGAAMPDKNLGTIGNTIAGLVGGGAGEYIIKALGLITTATAAGTTGDGHFDLTAILASIAAGGVGGGALTAIIGFVKEMIQKK